MATASPSLLRHLTALILTALVPTVGCAPVRPTRTPMPTVALASPPADGGRLFVLLPGLLDRAETFGEEGFGELISAAFPDAAVVATDAHLGYYRQRSLLDRLAEDVLAPRERAAQETWLVGVSLGGMGALLAAREMPGRIQGLILLAPYVGDRDELARIDAARAEPGGAAVADLKPRLRALARIWDGLEAPDRDGPRIILGYGESDRLADSAGRLADLLPPEDVLTVPGGHDWKTWRALLAAALERVAAP